MCRYARAWASVRKRAYACEYMRMLVYAQVCVRMRAYARVCVRMCGHAQHCKVLVAGMKLGEDRRVAHCTVGNPLRLRLAKQLDGARFRDLGRWGIPRLMRFDATRGCVAKSWRCESREYG